MNTSCYLISQDEYKIFDLSINQLKNEIEDYNKRDLYFFENNIKYDISSLTLKKNCIICKFDFIKAVIFVNKAYIIYKNFDEYKKNLENFCNNDSVFHINILEFLIMIVIDNLDNEFDKIYDNFRKLNTFEINNNFIKIQSNLVNLEYRVKELHTLTEELIQNKSDLTNISFGLISNNEIEQLIENYNLKLEDIYNDICKLIKEIDNIEKIINIKLAKDRNKYALFNLYLSFTSISISTGSLITGIFGMNLNNYIEDNSYSFIIVCTSIFLLIINLNFFIIKLFKFYK